MAHPDQSHREKSGMQGHGLEPMARKGAPLMEPTGIRQARITKSPIPLLTNPGPTAWLLALLLFLAVRSLFQYAGQCFVLRR